MLNPKLVVPIAGLILVSGVIPAEAQSYRNRHVNLFKTDQSRARLIIRLPKRPSKNLGISFYAFDADIPNEGTLLVNGNPVASLFGRQASPSNNNRQSRYKLVVDGKYVRSGINTIEVRHTSTLGFKLKIRGTWETDEPPNTAPPQQENLAQERVAQTPRSNEPPSASPLGRDNLSQATPVNEPPDTIAQQTQVQPEEIERTQSTSSDVSVSGSTGAPVIRWQEVEDQSTKPHDVTPIPAIPAGYCGSHYGSPVVPGINRKAGTTKCNRDPIDDSSALAGYTEFNIWNHVARNYSGQYAKPNGQAVEMGNTRLALLTKSGKWITREFRATCQGRLYAPVANGIDGGENGGNPVAQPCSDKAVLGYGLGRWTNSKHQYHGWPGQRMQVGGEQIEAVAGWFPAKLIGSNLSDNNQYLLNIGMDKKGGKAAGKTARFSGAFSSRYVKLPKNGSPAAIFGSTLSVDRWKELCQQGNLPAGFPFEKGCNDSLDLQPERASVNPQSEIPNLPPPVDISSDLPVITWASLVKQLTDRHDGAPVPSVPSHYCWAWNGIPSLLKHPQASKCDSNNQRSGRVPGSFSQNGNRFNPWTHVDSGYSSNPNLAVQFGTMKMAYFTKGRWITKSFPAPCGGYVYEKGNTEGRAGKAVSCSDDRSLATVGIGVRDWDSPQQHHHGWPGVNLNVGNDKIEQVIVYAPARLVPVNSGRSASRNNNKYTVAVGADSRSGEDIEAGKGRLTAITHGRHQLLPSDGSWSAITAHTMSAQQLVDFCEAQNLPHGFPFEKNCEVPLP